MIENPDQPAELPLDVRGTEFQMSVWDALQNVPAGTTVSYSALAEHIGAPDQERAVVEACGANPLAVAIPCHRAVHADGNLSGYRWGVERKRALIEREAAFCRMSRRR
jgi:AraC family transcriptional regulator of adaptative response/methylated-DNA-[protein]-cysteine methyltransferase